MPDAKQSIILGGLITGLLSTSYLGFINFICCLGVLIGTVVTIWHYTDTNELTISAGTGAKYGVFAALIGLGIATLLNFGLLQVGIDHSTAFSNFIIAKLGDSMPPEQIEAMEAAGEEAKSLSGVLKGLATGSVAFSIFGAIGGAIGAKMFKKGGDEPSDDVTIDEL